jgi:hypothetical protein
MNLGIILSMINSRIASRVIYKIPIDGSKSCRDKDRIGMCAVSYDKKTDMSALHNIKSSCFVTPGFEVFSPYMGLLHNGPVVIFDGSKVVNEGNTFLLDDKKYDHVISKIDQFNIKNQFTILLRQYKLHNSDDRLLTETNEYINMFHVNKLDFKPLMTYSTDRPVYIVPTSAINDFSECNGTSLRTIISDIQELTEL